MSPSRPYKNPSQFDEEMAREQTQLGCMGICERAEVFVPGHQPQWLSNGQREARGAFIHAPSRCLIVAAPAPFQNATASVFPVPKFMSRPLTFPSCRRMSAA